MQRRTFVGLGATLTIPALPRVSRAQSASLLRFVPASDLSILDPILTSTYITRNHGYMVFDQLYGSYAGIWVTP